MKRFVTLSMNNNVIQLMSKFATLSMNKSVIQFKNNNAEL